MKGVLHVRYFNLIYLFLFLAALGLSCGVQVPEHVGSVIAAHRLSS